MLSLVLLLGVGNNTFSMKPDEKFIRLNKEESDMIHGGSKAISPSGKYVASGSRDKKVIVYDIHNKKKICSYKHNGYVVCVCFSNDSKFVASGSGKYFE